MNITTSTLLNRKNLWRLPLHLLFAVSAFLVPQKVNALSLVALADIASVNLGNAGNFGVLAGSGITITGATTVIGDLGTFPTSTINGLEDLTLIGTNHAGDSVTEAAKISLLDAYNDAAGRTATVTYDPISDLGGLTLTPGVYKNPSSFGISGTLTLDAQGDPDAVWIFQSGSTLTTASDSEVVIINGGQAGNVFWQVGSSATLGTGSAFLGTIIADTSISLNTGATVEGRVLALNGAVTFQGNEVNALVVPEPGSAVLLAFGVLLLFSGRHRRQLHSI